MLNPFNNPAFSMAALTAAINLIPNRYGRLQELDLFPEKPVRQNQILVEERAGVLTLLPTKPLGAPGTLAARSKRRMRSFVVPHIPHDDVVLPNEVQGLRAFGSETELESIASVVAEKLETMRNKHAITLEHLRMGALKGLILDSDGSVLYDLFEEFRIAQQSVAFQIDNPNNGTDVKQKCIETLALIEEGLLGEFMTSARVLCSQEFFAALTSHKDVKTAYAQWQQGAVLINDVRKGFSFGGLVFEEYRGKASDLDGNVRRFIAPGEAHAFPIGTINSFATYNAPADFNETVNTLGQPVYAKQEPRKFERGTDMHTQSNPLPLCLRPSVLVKLSIN
jgi:hypothetical protein